MSSYPWAVGLLALASAASASPVSVEADPAPTERVSFADLDLLGHAGQATLQARIRAAAARLCDSYGFQPLAARLDETRCRRVAIADASRQKSHP